MKKHSITISYLDLARLAIFVFILYSFWYYGVFGLSIPLLYGTPILATLFVIIDMSKNSRSIKTGFYSIVPLFVSYFVYSLFSGIIVCINLSSLLSSLITFFAYTTLCYDICYISKVDNSMRWIMKELMIVSLICAIQTIFKGVSVRGSYGTTVVVMGVNTNPNTLGVIMIIGIFTTLYLSKNKGLFFPLLIVFSELYVIVLTASRKALIAVILILLLWVFEMLLSKDKEIKIYRKVLGLLFLLLGVIISLYYLRTFYLDSSLYIRLLNFDSGLSDRTDLLNKAFALWKTSPIFGIGFDQVKLYIGLYSHSTYYELLACSGVFGIITWLFFFIPFLKEIFVVIIKWRKTSISYQLFILLFMFLIELFLGLGQIWFYDFEHMVVLCVIIGSFQFVYNNNENCHVTI